MNEVNDQWQLNYFLLHIAVSCPSDAETLSQQTNSPIDFVHDSLKILLDGADVHVYEGYLRAFAAQNIIANSTPEDVLAAQTNALNTLDRNTLDRNTLGDSKHPSAATLIALTDSGCSEEKLLELLLEANEREKTDENLLKALEKVAAKNKISPEELKIRRAETAALIGNDDHVLNLTDQLLTSQKPEISIPASLLAASSHIRANRLERATALFKHVGHKNIASAGVWGVLAALGEGKLEQADSWHKAMGKASLTSTESGFHETTEGLLLSIEGDGEEAVNVLARAVSTLAPIGSNLIIPETPAALAAIIAIGRGEPHSGQQILEKALKTGLGGNPGKIRHTLLHAWTLMLQGHLDEAEKQVAGFTNLCARDYLLYTCLLTGIARRRTDLLETRKAWEKVRGHIVGMSITLYDMLPLSEMLMTAARLRDFDRVQPILHRAQDILEDLNNPIAWSAPLHWHAVQAAFLLEDPTALIPHANALVKAGKTSTYAATLAQAGNTWLGVLRRETDFDSVTESVHALARTGQVWDAARLAGQAALQHPEREEALSMMQLAREITKDHLRKAQSPVKSSLLTAREIEVGRLVLEGQGYRAIGEQLFISPKTVEHHVARIRNRLGASSRGELLEKLHDIVNG